MNTPTKDTLFYDGHCPLCSREINLLRKLTKDTLAFKDIHQYHAPEPSLVSVVSPSIHTSLPASDEPVPDKQIMLKVLHLQKADGQWLKGLDANIAVWENTVLWPLFSVFNLPVVKHIAVLIYQRWADTRYQKLYCQSLPDEQSCACGQEKSQ